MAPPTMLPSVRAEMLARAPAAVRAEMSTPRSASPHKNSCIRHLEQIGEVSGLDLEDPDVRLACSIALHLHERE